MGIELTGQGQVTKSTPFSLLGYDILPQSITDGEGTMLHRGNVRCVGNRCRNRHVRVECGTGGYPTRRGINRSISLGNRESRFEGKRLASLGINAHRIAREGLPATPFANRVENKRERAL